MSDRFEPRRVQAEHLRASGFTRDVLVALVRDASATASGDYYFTNENEATRMDAVRVLQALLADQEQYLLRETYLLTARLGLSDRTYWIAANLFIREYALGKDMTSTEAGLDGP